jgi:IPT/TIG domain
MMYRSVRISLILAMLPCMVATAAPLQSAASPQLQELQWPQSFDLRGLQVSAYGFAVTQPGPIVLDVKSQGAPLDVVLQGPIAQPLEQQGSGALRISYVVTPQDVQRGVLWHFIIRLTPAAAQAGAGSAGNVGVQHPPANPQAVQQALQTLVAQRHVPTAQERTQAASTARAQRDALFRARLAAGEQELVQHRTAVYQNLQPTIDAMRRQKAATAQSAAAVPPAPQAISASGVKTRALAPERFLRPIAPPTPVIASLSAAEGVPGDGIIITGSGFGTTDGEVHFVIGADPSLDKTTTPGVWVNNQIFAVVPDPSIPDPSVGAPTYSGVIYVVVGGVKSNLVPFRFDPIIDHRVIRIPADYLLGDFAEPGVDRSPWNDVARLNNNWVSNAAGEDQFYRNTLLQNGWTVESAPIAYIGGETGGGITMVLGRVGTNSPYADVFSWVDTVWVNSGLFDYHIEIPIQGPRGLPDGVVCTSKPAAGQACPSSQ